MYRLLPLLLCLFLGSCDFSGRPAPCPGLPADWEFSYDVRDEPRVWSPIVVPGYWTESGQLPNTGSGRYRLRIACTFQDIDSIYIAEISSAATVYWNGIEIARSGTPGKNRRQEVGRIAPLYVHLPDAGPGLLEIQVSNFHARAGGILGLSFGRETEFRKGRMQSLLVEAVVLGAINAAGLFFLLLYFSMRQTISHLLFAALMIACTLRSISSNSLLEEFWPARDWTDFRLLLEYLTAVAIMPPLYFAVIYMLLENQQGHRVLVGLRRFSARFIAAVYIPGGLILSLYFTLSGDASDYGRFQPYYVQYYLIPGLVFCLLFLLLSVASGERGAGILLAGFAGVLGGTLLDAESTIRGQAGSLYVPAGLLVFAVAFSISVGMQIWRERHELKEFRTNQTRHMGIAGLKQGRADANERTMLSSATSSARRIQLRLEKMLRLGAIARIDALPLMGLVRSLARRLDDLQGQSIAFALSPMDASAYFSAFAAAHDQVRVKIEKPGILLLVHRASLEEALAESRKLAAGGLLIEVKSQYIVLTLPDTRAEAATLVADSMRLAGARRVIQKELEVHARFGEAQTSESELPISERHRNLLNRIASMR